MRTCGRACRPTAPINATTHGVLTRRGLYLRPGGDVTGSYAWFSKAARASVVRVGARDRRILRDRIQFMSERFDMHLLVGWHDKHNRTGTGGGHVGRVDRGCSAHVVVDRAWGAWIADTVGRHGNGNRTRRPASFVKLHLGTGRRSGPGGVRGKSDNRNQPQKEPDCAKTETYQGAWIEETRFRHGFCFHGGVLSC